MNIGFPDVCNTPVGPAVVPIPYPNLAMNIQATQFSEIVKVSMMNALNLRTQIPMTTGDEAGTAGPTKGPGRYTMGNPIVYVDLMPAINLTCPTTGNNMNNPLGAVLVPSATNVFYCLRAPGGTAAGPPPAALDADAMASLGDALRPPGEVVSATLLDGAAGYIRAALFPLELPSLVHREVQALLGRGMAALVLDLRDNPGGDLDAFLRLADDFLDRDRVLIRMTDADGDETMYRSRQGDPYRFPLVLLVDRWTASAAELFAGCLQCHGRATLVGETTYGKGVARRLVAGLVAPGAHYPCVAGFALPDGRPVQGAGVRPDVEVPPSAADGIAGDPALRVAAELAARLAASADNPPDRMNPEVP
jgi:carboxyl-terminal processing protease